MWASARVCVGDLDVAKGQALEAEFEGYVLSIHTFREMLTFGLRNVKFVKCNVLDWENQLQLFREAAAFAPNGKISYVIANAGIITEDEVFSFAGEQC